MSETCGGCVYDGRPLPAREVARRRRRAASTSAAPPSPRLPGPTRPHRRGLRPTLDGRRWFRTDDSATGRHGRLHVDGRLDDLIITGGLKVAPRLVEEALPPSPASRRPSSSASPTTHWGEAVSAPSHGPGAAAPAPRPRRWTPARAAARRPPGARPAGPAPGRRRAPLRGPGKPDRPPSPHCSGGP